MNQHPNVDQVIWTRDNRMIQHSNGSYQVLEKDPAYIFGERVVRPLIDLSINLGQQCWTVTRWGFSYLSQITSHTFKFPGAQAATVNANHDSNPPINVLKNNPLHEAARNGQVDDIPELLKSIYIDRRDSEGRTPLHVAIQFGQCKFLRELLVQGATTIAWDKLSPEALAVKYGQFECFKILYKHRGISWDVYTEEIGYIPHVAINYGQPSMLSKLLHHYPLEIKPYMSKPNYEGDTPLHIAALFGYTEAILILADCQADLTIRNKNQKMAIELAADGRQEKAVEYLVHLMKIDDLPPPKDTYSDYIQNLLQRKKLTGPLSYPTPENILFPGGGAKGLALIGVIQQLEDEKILENIKRVGGTSAGAITATLLSMGLELKNIEELVGNTSLIDFLDPMDKSTGKTWYQSMLTFGYESWTPQMFQNFVKGSINLILESGYAKGEIFRKWIEKEIALATGREYCTFGELYDLIKDGKVNEQTGRRLVHLHVFGTRIDKKTQIVHFSSEPEYEVDGNLIFEYKDDIISDSARISISLPGLFVPHYRHFKINGERVAQPQLGKHIDGGLLNNVPVAAFDQARFLRSNEKLSKEMGRKHVYNPGTLAFKFYSSYQSSPGVLMSSLGWLTDKLMPTQLLQMAAMWYKAEEVIHDHVYPNDDRIIDIDSKRVATTDFDINERDKTQLIRSGRQAVKQFIRQKEIYFDNLKLQRDFKSLGSLKACPRPLFRKNDIKQLKNKVQVGQNPVVLVGPKGSGKAEFARGIANECLKDFDRVIWIESDTLENRKQTYRKLADGLEVPSNLPDDELPGKILEKLNQKEKWLLVFNHLDSPLVEWEECLFSKSIRHKRGFILATSTIEGKWGTPDEEHKLSFLKRDEAIQFIKSTFEEEDCGQIDELIDAMGCSSPNQENISYSPVTLSMVAKVIEMENCSIAQFLEKISNNAEFLSDKVTECSTFILDGQNVYAAKEKPVEKGSYLEMGSLMPNALWEVLLDDLKIQSPLTLEWIQLCSYFNSKGIPKEWLKEWLITEKQLDFVQANLQSDHIFRTLQEYEFISDDETTETFSVDSLMQEWTRKAIDEPHKLQKTQLAALSWIREGGRNFKIENADVWREYDQYKSWIRQASAIVATPDIENVDFESVISIYVRLLGIRSLTGDFIQAEMDEKKFNELLRQRHTLFQEKLESLYITPTPIPVTQKPIKSIIPTQTSFLYAPPNLEEKNREVLITALKINKRIQVTKEEDGVYKFLIDDKINEQLKLSTNLVEALCQLLRQSTSYDKELAKSVITFGLPKPESEQLLRAALATLYETDECFFEESPSFEKFILSNRLHETELQIREGRLSQGQIFIKDKWIGWRDVQEVLEKKGELDPVTGRLQGCRLTPDGFVKLTTQSKNAQTITITEQIV